MFERLQEILHDGHTNQRAVQFKMRLRLKDKFSAHPIFEPKQTSGGENQVTPSWTSARKLDTDAKSNVFRVDLVLNMSKIGRPAAIHC